ncbi:hypothetical protein FDP41_004571 [Naegleria fowleri]|uniref:UBA domain-containing protein n=1 Tax=Naegleria fowleri TaxID=5763 RepID=A0A6A5BPF0_NAEFO|nr:uncharacterized protein FDP41_004571 [Naegleria fowleri]KAF0976672.1 hypothetical protein FDP41_004571 [Naegleria fowleri]CAG4708132.1 unnamed protein product [Naegleria fowleri]
MDYGPNSIAFPSDLSQLTITEQLGGSSHPQKVKDLTTNQEYVMKKGFNKRHVVNEYRVNLCYYKMGCLVPQVKLYVKGKMVSSLEGIESLADDDHNDIVVLSEFINNGITWANFQKQRSEQECDQVRREMGHFFVLDCLFANRDVIGVDDSNILIVEQQQQALSPRTFSVYRIDNGGALSFRAQGKPKDPGEWGDFVSEINLMLDDSFNVNTANVFGKGGAVDSNKMFQQIMTISDHAQRCIYPYLSSQDVQIVKERLNYLRSIVGLYDFTATTSNSTTTTSTTFEVTEADPQLVQTLMEMGFSKEQSSAALIASNNNVEAALSFLF